MPSREPEPVHANRAQIAAIRIIDRDVAHRGVIAVPERRNAGFEIVQRVDPLRIHHGDHGAAWNSGGSEHITGVSHIDPPRRHVEMPRLLIRQGVRHRVPKLRVGARRNGMQIADWQLRRNRLATALEIERHLLSDRLVDHLVEGIELRDVVAVHLHQDIAWLQHVLTWGPGQHSGHHQHTGVLRKGLAHRGLGAARQPEAF